MDDSEGAEDWNVWTDEPWRRLITNACLGIRKHVPDCDKFSSLLLVNSL